jgi:hypothetical protein
MATAPVFRSRFLTIGDGEIDGIPPDNLTYAIVRDGKVKYKTIRKSKLLLLCTNLLDHIKDLELRHMRIPRENPTRNISNNNARLAKPDDKYLSRLEAECRAEELKARIRETKMMSQGISYSQMVEGPPHRVPAHVARRAVRTARGCRRTA